MVDVHADILGQLFAKYRHSPNILKLLEILSNPLQDTNDALDWILEHLSIDEAEGPLLVALASWIGVIKPPAQEKNILILCRDEEVADDPDNHHGLAPDDLSSGGYLTGDDGCLSQSDPGSYVPDPEFRRYIKAKAATFRKKATREVIFDYLLRFDARCKFTYGTREVQIEPSRYGDLDYSVRHHLTHRGFRPVGVKISIKRQTAPDSEV